MIEVIALRKGVTFELEGGLFKVLEYSHNKTGRGNASIKVKARNLLTGARPSVLDIYLCYVLYVHVKYP